MVNYFLAISATFCGLISGWVMLRQTHICELELFYAWGILTSIANHAGSSQCAKWIDRITMAAGIAIDLQRGAAVLVPTWLFLIAKYLEFRGYLAARDLLHAAAHVTLTGIHIYQN